MTKEQALTLLHEIKDMSLPWNDEHYEALGMAIKKLENERHPTTHLIKYWTERKDGYGIEHIPHCKCANCGVDYLPRMAMAMNYCPNCGARFVKERDDNG